MDYSIIVKKVLSKYNIVVKETFFIRHNENYTLKIEDINGQFYVLRIHKSNNKMQTIGQHSYDCICSEMIILKSIRDSTSIKTQEPLYNKDNKIISIIEDEDGNEIYATILKWIPGEILNIINSNYKNHLHETGVMLGEFHNFSMNWTEGKKLIRPKFDEVYLDNMAERISQGVSIGIINKVHLKSILEVIKLTKVKLVELSSKYRDDWYGLSHCDISKSNLIIFKDTVTPIDFSLSTVNYFFMDIAGFICDLSDKPSTKIFLEGYKLKRNLKEEHMQYIEIYFVQCILGFMSYHIFNENMYEWFYRRIEPIYNDYFLPVLNNESNVRFHF